MSIKEIESPDDLEMVLIEANIGLRKSVGAVIIVTKSEAGARWCDTIVGRSAGRVWNDVLKGSAVRDEKNARFFITIDKEEGLRQWVFQTDMDREAAKVVSDDVALILQTVNSDYLCPAIPGAGIIFNGLISQD